MMTDRTPWGPFPTHINKELFYRYLRKHGYPQLLSALPPEESKKRMWAHWAKVWRDYVDGLIEECDKLAARLEDAAAHLRSIYESVFSGAYTDYSELMRVGEEASRVVLSARLTLGKMYKIGCFPAPEAPRPFSTVAITPKPLLEVESGQLLKAHQAADSLERLVTKWRVTYRSYLEEFKSRITPPE